MARHPSGAARQAGAPGGGGQLDKMVPGTNLSPGVDKMVPGANLSLAWHVRFWNVLHRLTVRFRNTGALGMFR